MNVNIGKRGRHGSAGTARARVGLAWVALLGALLSAQAAEAQSHHRTTHARPRAAAARAVAGVVNLNTATAAELQRLPGIGPSKADAILALRRRVHRFRRIEEVMRVRGVGRATFRHLRSMLTVSGPTTLPAPPSRRPSPTASNGGGH